MSKISAKDVVNFFKEAELDISELILEIGGQHVAAKRDAKVAASQRMAKARAGRGKGKKAAVIASPAEAATASIPANTANSPGRRAVAGIGGGRVPAPAHTAAATSVESDSEMTASA